MCSVSAVMDYGRQAWPNWQQLPNQPLRPAIGPLPTPSDEKEAIKRFLKLVEAAEQFDKAADQPHCEDPEKIKLLEKVVERLQRIEKFLGIADDA